MCAMISYYEVANTFDMKKINKSYTISYEFLEIQDHDQDLCWS